MLLQGPAVIVRVESVHVAIGRFQFINVRAEEPTMVARLPQQVLLLLVLGRSELTFEYNHRPPIIEIREAINFIKTREGASARAATFPATQQSTSVRKLPVRMAGSVNALRGTSVPALLSPRMDEPPTKRAVEYTPPRKSCAVEISLRLQSPSSFASSSNKLSDINSSKSNANKARAYLKQATSIVTLSDERIKRLQKYFFRPFGCSFERNTPGIQPTPVPNSLRPCPYNRIPPVRLNVTKTRREFHYTLGYRASREGEERQKRKA
ncbi:hypothetical protein WN55_00520 [Dufourea novaeangliae]|uniref:Uncharacterized protein n=1 Tax=Dufourea novaeangliae TaxID=178035 RepID=A0A154PEL9_DUFNO|nr:hypothetical protein WN55_00520 [Dufourea novaeangliae]